MHVRSSRVPRALEAMTHHGSPVAPSAAEMVRTFYERVLGGRRVWPSRGADAAGSEWFLVGSTLLEARTAAGEEVPTPIALEVDAPTAVAERCWDAGFAVRVRDDETGRARLSVIDPFGRRIELIARRTAGRRLGVSNTAARRGGARSFRRKPHGTP
jgi:catechol 2,3-dioxygenase-like lactoylglutathione lyase family enzyme